MKFWGHVPSRLARNETLLTLVIFFGSYPVIYTVNLLLSRALGPANYGDFAVTRSVATLTATFALLGMNKASLNLLPVYRKRGAHDAAKGFIFVSLPAILLAGLLLSVVGFVVTQALSAGSSGELHPVRIASSG